MNKGKELTIKPRRHIRLWLYSPPVRIPDNSGNLQALPDKHLAYDATWIYTEYADRISVMPTPELKRYLAILKSDLEVQSGWGQGAFQAIQIVVLAAASSTMAVLIASLTPVFSSPKFSLVDTAAHTVMWVLIALFLLAGILIVLPLKSIALTRAKAVLFISMVEDVLQSRSETPVAVKIFPSRRIHIVRRSGELSQETHQDLE